MTDEYKQCVSSNVETDFSSDSDYETCKIGYNNSHMPGTHSDQSISDQKKSIKMDSDDLLNKIINGQKDDIDLVPISCFNSGNI